MKMYCLNPSNSSINKMVWFIKDKIIPVNIKEIKNNWIVATLIFKNGISIKFEFKKSDIDRILFRNRRDAETACCHE